MEIVCNGEKRHVAPGTGLVEFIRSLELDPATVVVECDGLILAKETYEGQELQDGMVLELIQFVGGG